MPDIIQLLPESVANQIAAGEVVQRPASVVKELLENGIDAGATVIKLVVKDAGKTLVQVTDNGSGMSETDARMSFERHATSKIRKSEDLFHISTKGFRGEALASIAAVAQVELRSRRAVDELGVEIAIDASEVKKHELIQCPEGSTFMVKNLFFNVPARRYFLKSDAIELKHITDEFHRVVLTHPDIHFSFTHNNTEVFTLQPATLRQRIVHVFGNRYNEKLVPVEEETDIVRVHGFVGKPDASKKNRGEQFFFVNNRFIRNSYLHHAVMSAFDRLITPGTFPFYTLYLEVDPHQIDINIHPTKTEIKFQDDRSVYAILHASIRRALGKFNIAPTIDFDQESSIRVAPLDKHAEIKPPSIKVNHDYNPFEPQGERISATRNWLDKKPTQSDWKELMQIGADFKPATDSVIVPSGAAILSLDLEAGEKPQLFQLRRKFIVTSLSSGLAIIDQQRAHQRILFERYLSQLEKGNASSQQVLFPEIFDPGPAKFAMFLNWKPDLEKLGFAFGELENNQVEITGLPTDAGSQNPVHLIDELLGRLGDETNPDVQQVKSNLAMNLARSTSIRYGQMLSKPEMEALVEQLCACETPNFLPNGNNVMTIFNPNQLDQYFR